VTVRTLTRGDAGIAVGIARVPAYATSFPGRFPRWDDLSRAEREYCAAQLPRADRYAGRIAAKHAIRDALSSTGCRRGFRDIEVLNDRHGRPWARVAPREDRDDPSGGPTDHEVAVSIAHRRGRAIALAVAQRVGAGRTSEPLDIGVDLVERRRVEEADQRTLARLSSLVLTAEERSTSWFSSAPAQSVLIGMTVKEAVAKAMKRTVAVMTWHDVTLSPDVEMSRAFEGRVVARALARHVGVRVGVVGRAAAIDAGLWFLTASDGIFAYAVAGRSRSVLTHDGAR
jgi:phosphopantetheinyl transferase (holo-ACP synthase)